MPLYALREPSRRSWNLYALREAARLKKWLLGVYYSPRLRRLLAVFKPSPGTHVNMEVFEEIPGSVLRGAYRMECPRGCGRCCALQSGAFMLDVEARRLPAELRSLVEAQPSRLEETPAGPVRVYRLDTGPMGRCVFFDPETGGCRLEEEAGREAKPIVCLLTYCTVFASRGGRRYLKTGYRVLGGGRVEVHYREAGEEEWRRAVERMARVWRGRGRPAAAPSGTEA